jgi:hypothetical protein
LKTDIAEAKNVAAEHPEVVSRLGKLLADFKADLKKNSRPAGGPPPKPRKPRKPRQKKPKKTDTKKKA